jgi:hypothetical protein
MLSFREGLAGIRRDKLRTAALKKLSFMDRDNSNYTRFSALKYVQSKCFSKAFEFAFVSDEAVKMESKVEVKVEKMPDRNTVSQGGNRQPPEKKPKLIR